MAQEHVGPFQRRLIEAWLLELETYIDHQITSSVDGLEQFAADAEQHGYQQVAENAREGIALRRDTVKQLKKYYLG